MCFCPAESHCTPVSVMSICMGSVMYINYVTINTTTHVRLTREHA